VLDIVTVTRNRNKKSLSVVCIKRV
jgi:hypothetical protein